jgi:hypothetical protein
VVSARLTVTPGGLITWIYGAESRYPYERLLIYHFGRDATYELSNVDEARRYFRIVSPDRAHACPSGHEGRGVAVFWPERLRPDGQLLRGSGPGIYVTHQGRKRVFRDWDSYLDYGGAPDLSNVITLSDAELYAIRDHDPVPK